MNIREFKKDSKEFAFNNKMLVWKPMLVLMAIAFIASFIASIGFAIHDVFGTFLDLCATVFIWLITPVFTAGLYLLIKAHLKGKDDTFEQTIEVIKPKWSNFFMTCVMMNVFIWLWSLLFIIPGIVKSYSYSQALYIQAENPDMNWKDCIRKSQEMMNGHKMELFLVHLSFIGWAFLVALSFGIVAIWVVPYIQVVTTKYYMYLSNDSDVVTVDANVVVEHVVVL